MSRWRRCGTCSRASAGASRRCVARSASAPRTTSADEQARTADVALTRFEDVGEARRVLLGRRAIGDAPLPAAVSEKIREMFGEALTPTQVVERIIADVRADGDQAIRRYTRLIDGREPEELRVSEDAIETAASTIPAEV